ncbi:hypothetical protein CORC01_09020 [Colletotrichum orchidophilum]|uniref:Uncharacterized protein n=1 Tax=Colletotrichum orchidophilum TaxID=1209926 RepID=A0A1G4B303_9PEZI|nr:uncharacterized protein CORC01_09020 [Colletotrichum orchidophilum]OHE95736.1 hypothetical protein CORC01_09020 [Colletotrichum orchidophilum]
MASNAQAPRVPSSARQFFVFDTHPTGSLEASVVTYDTSTATYQVACPTGDVGCQKEGYWPANITHIDGSSWIGRNTATSGIEKCWNGRLGSGGGDVLKDQYRRCHVSTSTPSLSTGTMNEELPVNKCFVEARSVVVAITTGLEKVEALDFVIVVGDGDRDGYGNGYCNSYCNRHGDWNNKFVYACELRPREDGMSAGLPDSFLSSETVRDSTGP